MSKRVLVAAVAAVLLFGVLFPLYWGVRTSFAGGYDSGLWPSHPTLTNYRYIFSNGDFANTIVNSLIVSVGAVMLAVPTAILAAYALARLDFAGKRLSSLLFLLPLIPAVAVLVPLIVYVRELGFIAVIPRELEDAAQVDGCGRVGALRRVVLPLISPGLVATTAFVFITSWNNYLIAVAFTSAEQLRVVPVAIVGYMSAWGTNYPGMSAAATLAMLPPLIFFFAVQRWFVQGLLAGSSR
jgi:N,N'-diacetylchitobiose transport system permease protein